MDPELVRRFFRQTIDEIRSVQFGVSGPTSTTVASNVACRWEEKTEYLLDKAEQQVVSRATAYVGPETPVEVDYEVVYQGKVYTVIKVAAEVDGDGFLIFKQIWVN